jgi:hypothetical protein
MGWVLHFRTFGFLLRPRYKNFTNPALWDAFHRFRIVHVDKLTTGNMCDR